MRNEYKPLENIVDEPQIKKGSLFLLKKMMTGDFFGPREIIKPVIFGGSDTYIHDEVNRIEHVDFIQDEGTFVKGSQTKGIRVYHLVVDGKLTVDASLRNNYFYDEEKGFFVPFEEDNIQYSYNPSTQ